MAATLMTSQTGLAFTLANGFATQLITLALAMIGLTVTFAKDFRHSIASKIMLLFIWIFFSLSIIVGIFNIKSIISVIAPLESTDIEPKMNEEIYSLASSQEALFFVGLLVFVLLGVFAFSARQRTATTPDEAKKSWAWLRWPKRPDSLLRDNVTGQGEPPKGDAGHLDDTG